MESREPKQTLKYLLSEVSAYVLFLLEENLPAKLTFHNIGHTLNVVAGVREIGLKSGLTADEQTIAEIAAWLHDTGYFHKYIGHEDESKRLSAIILEEKGASADIIDKVQGCIEATKYPQNPKNLVEQVLCDADFYHFTLPEYAERASRLRDEWCFYLERTFTDSEWNAENCKLLDEHKYFTAYGQTVLQSLKEKNLRMIQWYCR